MNLGVINENAPTAGGTRATSTSIVILTILVTISVLTAFPRSSYTMGCETPFLGGNL